jgi:hypothetical protein
MITIGWLVWRPGRWGAAQVGRDSNASAIAGTPARENEMAGNVADVNAF